MFWYLSTDHSWNMHAQQSSWTKGLYIVPIYVPSLSLWAAMDLARLNKGTRFQLERDKIEFGYQCMFLSARFSILLNICGKKLNKIMQIKHVKDRKKKLAFSVYLIFL